MILNSTITRRSSLPEKRGFGADDTLTIASSSQYVDDNDIIYEINKNKAPFFRN